MAGGNINDIVGSNILVIDDELVMCELLRDLLQEKGCTVKYALSGEDGIKAFQQEQFDAVMCDLKMPDMDGIEVLEKIKELNPGIIFIVMTGYPTFDSLQVVLRRGGFDYVTKPFDMKEISSVVERAFVFRNLSVANKTLVEELKKQNIKLEKEAKESKRELEAFRKTKIGISPALRFDEVFKIIVDRVCRLLNVDICSILLLEEDAQDLIISAAEGLDKEVASPQTRVKLGDSISGWVAKNKQAVLVKDIEADARFSKRSQEKYYTHSFISAPLIVKDEVIGVINVNNKKSREPFTEDDLRFLKGVADGAAIAIENVKQFIMLEDRYISTVVALASAIDAKDHYTKDHSEHVAEYAVDIAKEMKLSEGQIQEIKQACQLHDLGNIGVHDYILTKEGKLTPEEWDEVRQHSLKSAEILRPLVFLDGVIDLVEQHHERYDGKGYPRNLKGEEIALGARIIAVADSFDAMVSDRPYRKALPKEKAIEELKKGSGSQFDPKVVEAFLRALEKSDKI